MRRSDERYPFWYFSDDQLWLFNFHLISQNWNILISTHLIAKLKIVLESLWSREDMVKNPFSYFEFFTSGNPCDSSPPPRRNHELGTLEKFLKHGFSFFNPNIPLSLEPESNENFVSYSMKTHTWTWKSTFDKNPKKFRRQIANTQLSLSKLSFDKKHWLNFLDFPFSSRQIRDKARYYS